MPPFLLPVLSAAKNQKENKKQKQPDTSCVGCFFKGCYVYSGITPEALKLRAVPFVSLITKESFQTG